MIGGVLIPRDWPRYLAIDFGYTNPFVCLWAAKDTDGRLFIYRQIYKTKTLVEDHAENYRRSVWLVSFTAQETTRSTAKSPQIGQTRSHVK